MGRRVRERAATPGMKKADSNEGTGRGGVGVGSKTWVGQAMQHRGWENMGPEETGKALVGWPSRGKLRQLSKSVI